MPFNREIPNKVKWLLVATKLITWGFFLRSDTIVDYTPKQLLPKPSAQGELLCKNDSRIFYAQNSARPYNDGERK